MSFKMLRCLAASKLDADDELLIALERCWKKHGIQSHNDNKKIINKMKRFKVWGFISTDNKQQLRTLAAFFSVPIRTIQYWNSQVKIDPDWTPYKKTVKSFIRVFTAHQFQILINTIREICDCKKIIVTNSLIKALTIQYYNQLNYHPHPQLLFNASDHYIIKLKKFISYSTRRFHFKRRPDLIITNIIYFLYRLRYLFESNKNNQTVNTDESFFRLNEYKLSTWATKGSSSVLIEDNINEKEGFTFLATISATGIKFPLILIASGSTTVAEGNWFGKGRNILEQSEDIQSLHNPLYQITSTAKDTEFITPDSLTDHSPKGWSNSYTYKNFLKVLRTKWLPQKGASDEREDRIYLVADTYGSHRSEATLNFCYDNNIDYIPVPEGATDLLQPLDDCIFGSMKSKSKCYLQKRLADYVLKKFDFATKKLSEFVPPDPLSKQDATIVLEILWKELNATSVLEAWKHSIEDKFSLIDNKEEFSEDEDYELRRKYNKEERQQIKLQQDLQKKIKSLKIQNSRLMGTLNIENKLNKALEELKNIITPLHKQLELVAKKDTLKTFPTRTRRKNKRKQKIQSTQFSTAPTRNLPMNVVQTVPLFNTVNTQTAASFIYQPNVRTQDAGSFNYQPNVNTQEVTAFNNQTTINTQAAGSFNYQTNARTQDAGSFNYQPHVNTQEVTAFNSQATINTQAAGSFNYQPHANTQEVTAFNSQATINTQAAGSFNYQPHARTQDAGSFNYQPHVNTQEVTAFNNQTTINTQAAGSFNYQTNARTQDAGSFNYQPHVNTQEVTAFNSQATINTQAAGSFNYQPHANTQEVTAFNSQATINTQAAGSFNYQTNARTQDAGSFNYQPHVNTQEVTAFNNQATINTQAAGSFNYQPHANTQEVTAFNSQATINTQAAGSFNYQPHVNTQAEIIHDTENHSPIRIQQETPLIHQFRKAFRPEKQIQDDNENLISEASFLDQNKNITFSDIQQNNKMTADEKALFILHNLIKEEISKNNVSIIKQLSDKRIEQNEQLEKQKNNLQRISNTIDQIQTMIQNEKEKEERRRINQMFHYRNQIHEYTRNTIDFNYNSRNTNVNMLSNNRNNTSTNSNWGNYNINFLSNTTNFNMLSNNGNIFTNNGNNTSINRPIQNVSFLSNNININVISNNGNMVQMNGPINNLSFMSNNSSINIMSNNSNNI